MTTYLIRKMILKRKELYLNYLFFCFLVKNLRLWCYKSLVQMRLYCKNILLRIDLCIQIRNNCLGVELFKKLVKNARSKMSIKVLY